MNEPTMTQVLENVDAELNKDPAVSRFAPPKLRNQIMTNSELENIQHDLRKSLADLAEIQRRLQIYCDNLKSTVETLTRSAG